MKNATRLLLLLAVAAMLLAAGCTQQQPAPAATPAPAVTPAPAASKPADTIGVAASPLGTILVDAQGKTLYYFAKDVPGNGASACAGQCAAIWPAFPAGTVQVSPPLDPAEFSSITRADGATQTTYYGRPLYYYASDTKPGDANGEGFNNLWYIANVSGTLPVVTTPTAAFHPLSPTGGGSY